jgi:hypothetical protein
LQEGVDSCIRLLATTDKGHGDDLGADDPEAVGLMVAFLYHHNYTAPKVLVTTESCNQKPPSTGTKKKKMPHAPKITPTGDCNTTMHARLYALGSKYGINSLQEVAKIKFAEAATYAWNHSDFITAAEIVYTTTPDTDKGLRDIVSRTIVEHAAVITGRPRMEQCIRGIDGLAYDLFNSKSTLEAEVKSSSCNTIDCGTRHTDDCATCGDLFFSCACNTSRRCNKSACQLGV